MALFPLAGVVTDPEVRGLGAAADGCWWKQKLCHVYHLPGTVLSTQHHVVCLPREVSAVVTSVFQMKKLRSRSGQASHVSHVIANSRGDGGSD